MTSTVCLWNGLGQTITKSPQGARWRSIMLPRGETGVLGLCVVGGSTEGQRGCDVSQVVTCYALLCGAMQCYAVPCGAMLSSGE